MSDRPKIVAIGEAMIEFAPVDGGHYQQSFAGDTFNTACHVAGLLGPEAETCFVSCVGQDPLSDKFVDKARDHGIETGTIWRDPDRSMGLYVIKLDEGERSFQYWREASAARRLADDSNRLDDALARADTVYLSGISLAILSDAARDVLMEAVTRARAEGARVAFDPNYRPVLWQTPDAARAAFAAMFEITDIALPSFDDEKALWGDDGPTRTLDRLASHSIEEIAVKDGGGPVLTFEAGRRNRFDTGPVGSLRDTTGAGDAFNAGYLAGVLVSAPHHERVALGQSLASEVLGHFGALIPAERMAAIDLRGGFKGHWPERGRG